MKQVYILKSKFEELEWHNVAVFSSFDFAYDELKRLKQQYSNINVSYSVEAINLFEF